MISELGRTYFAGLLSPTSFLGLALIIGTLFVWMKNYKAARWILTGTTFFFIVTTTAPLKYVLYEFVEPEGYPAHPEITHVVVLGGKIFPNQHDPLSSQITPSLLSRLTYGIAIVKAMPGTTLVLTGNGAGEKTEADLMELFALQMGVEKERIIVEKESMNTSDHPKYLKSVLTGKKFGIVTSAYHMNRALHAFAAEGLHGHPLPTDYQNKNSLSAASLIMRGENLSSLDRLFTEFYSSLWIRIKAIF